MVNSSAFLTTYWANKAEHSQRVAIVQKKGKGAPFFPFLPEQISWQSLQHIIEQLNTFLSSQPSFSSAQLVAYSGADRLVGLLCYCTVLAMGKKILPLNPALSTSQIQQRCEENGVDYLIEDSLFANFSENITTCRLPTLFTDKPATLTLTSGSTGTPKAVVHSIENHLASAEGVCELLGFEQEKSWLLSLPLHHVSGQGIIWRWLLKGATLFVYEDKDDFFDLLSQVSHASLVPTQLQRYLGELKTPSELPPSTLLRASQKFLLGGASIPASLIEQAIQQGITLFPSYGMTEMASTICATQNAINHVGKALKGREVQIVDDEIWVKGSPLALGYWQKNGEIRPLTNAQGWLQTKDLGAWDNQGNLIVKGRLDNMFISGGENIQPEDIEKTLYQSGLIKQIFVLPVADLEFGERPVAMVEFIDSFSEQAVEKLQFFAKNQLEKFKQPIHYFPLEMGQKSLEQQGGIKISRQQLQQALRSMLKANQSVVKEKSVLC